MKSDGFESGGPSRALYCFQYAREKGIGLNDREGEICPATRRTR